MSLYHTWDSGAEEKTNKGVGLLYPGLCLLSEAVSGSVDWPRVRFTPDTPETYTFLVSVP